MNKKIVTGTIIILVLIFITYLTFSTRITVKGPRITIDSWGHHIEGIVKNELTYSYVLKDQGVTMGIFSGDGFVTAVAQERADALRAKYGDFFRCDSAGKEEAIQSAQGIIFLAQNSTTKNAISEALSGIKKNPTQVSFNGKRIIILKNTYFGLNVEDTTGTEILYVKDFKILGPFKP